MPISENGPWTARAEGLMIFVGSDDFMHDVRMEITGDFSDEADRLAYGKAIAKVLNAAMPLCFED